MPSHATAQHNSEIRRRQLDGEDITAADHSSMHAIPTVDNPAAPSEFPATRMHHAPRVTDRYRLEDGSLSPEGDERATLLTGLPHEGLPGAKGPRPGDEQAPEGEVGAEGEEAPEGEVGAEGEEAPVAPADSADDEEEPAANDPGLTEETPDDGETEA